MKPGSSACSPFISLYTPHYVTRSCGLSPGLSPLVEVNLFEINPFFSSKYSNHLIQQAILTQTQERKAILTLSFVVQKRLVKKKKEKKKTKNQIIHQLTFTTKSLRGEKKELWEGGKTQRRFACFHL